MHKGLFWPHRTACFAMSGPRRMGASTSEPVATCQAIFERSKAQRSLLGAFSMSALDFRPMKKEKAVRHRPKLTSRNHVFDRDRRVDKNSVRYLQGADVGRYEINWSGLWMQYGPWLSQPRESGIFQRPRVLIREITGRLPYCIHATFVDKHYLNNKSVLNVLHEADDHDELKCLTAVLNSCAFSIYYKARAVKGARTVFPKLLINNLRELPYPKKIAKPEEAAAPTRRSRADL